MGEGGGVSYIPSAEWVVVKATHNHCHIVMKSCSCEITYQALLQEMELDKLETMITQLGITRTF